MNENISTAWDEEKLNELIRDKIEESYSLEYKGAGAFSRDEKIREKAKTEITKDVSSMANSAGGVLIYGLAEFNDKPREHLPERIDPVSRKDFSREWLENIILQIRPRISGLKIHSVQLSSGSDHVAYVVEIPEGSTAHQARDCIYYRRFNFQAVPMPDNEVRDVMSRKAHPTVSVSAKFTVYPRQTKNGFGGALLMEIENTSDVLARYSVLIVRSPLEVRGLTFFYEGGHPYLENDEEHGYAYRLLFSNHDAAPLFPRGKLRAMFKFKITPSLLKSLGKESEKQLDHFRWVVFADSMPKRSGTFTVDEIYDKQVEFAPRLKNYPS